MSLLTRLLGGRAAAPAGSEAAKPGQWRCLLVPAVDQPFSNRCLEVAYRLAQGTGRDGSACLSSSKSPAPFPWMPPCRMPKKSRPLR